jgi:hypothetical protein
MSTRSGPTVLVRSGPTLWCGAAPRYGGWRRLGGLGDSFLAGAGGSEPVGLAAGLHDQRVEGEPVHDRGGQARVGEGLAPLGEWCVGGDSDGGLLLAFGQDLEQQLGAAAVQVQVAELVQAQQVIAALAGHGAGQDAVAGGLEEFEHRLFSRISSNWGGRPLSCHEVDDARSAPPPPAPGSPSTPT